MEQIDAKICFVTWCGNRLEVKGMCKQHYHEHNKTGVFAEHIRMYEIHRTYFREDMTQSAFAKKVRGIVRDLPCDKRIKANFYNSMVTEYNKKRPLKKRGSVK